jgi:death-on-curing protein
VVYLTVEDVARINARFIGPDGLMELGLLESAVFRPLTTVGGYDAYPTLHAKAAALFHSLTRNHAFVNGNKRTAVVAVGAFLWLNGYRLTLPWRKMVALATDTAEGMLDVDAIAKKLEAGTEITVGFP